MFQKQISVQSVFIDTAGGNDAVDIVEVLSEIEKILNCKSASDYTLRPESLGEKDLTPLSFHSKFYVSEEERKSDALVIIYTSLKFFQGLKET